MKASSVFALVLLVGGVNALHQKPSKAGTPQNSSANQVKDYLNLRAPQSCHQHSVYGPAQYNFCIGRYDMGAVMTQNAVTTNLELIRSDHLRIDDNILNTTNNTSGISTNTSSITTNASGVTTNTSSITTNASRISSNDTDISTNASGISSNVTKISSLQSLVKSSGSEVQIGSNNDGVTISSSAVRVGGENLIRKASDGSVHIGKNSLVLKESGGRQQMWATNAAGESIDIDINNGSRLLINGRDVEKSIDNVGALSAALGSVPTVSADSQFTCGFGGGTHSSAYAFSGGCASRVSDRVSVNAALATVVNNHTGDADDNLSARAGFTFRLGKIDDSPKVAARKAAELHDEVAKLREENHSMRAESLMQKQINSSLAARLEQLERIASSHLSLLGDRASID